MKRIALSQDERRFGLAWLKRAKDGKVTPCYAAEQTGVGIAGYESCLNGSVSKATVWWCMHFVATLPVAISGTRSVLMC
jgi:hypothetical protein